ncbi:hypothetical protein ACL6C3_18550 [Capilliphycus salinus ALCB114379]|uniref:hypothetical protein n=1 Tax=Capilliphycus salinus TaxID=2768948 RepID=UPI0039A65D9E
MSDREQVQIDGFRVSGPVQGKRIEVEFDVKPTRERKSSSYSNSSDEWDSIWFLFILLFSLVFFVGNTVGTGPNPFPDSFYPSSSNLNSLSRSNR